ncbi:hypothetical protein Tco_0467230, partial [Tanacetum coccineum]
TVDACKIAHEMWEAIERLQQGESLNIQDVTTNLFWVFGKFTSHDGETIESYYIRFYKMMNEMIRNRQLLRCKSMFNFFNNFNQNGQDLSQLSMKQQYKLDEVSYCRIPRSFHGLITRSIAQKIKH